MGKKVVFFDIDGTLLNHNMELPRSTKESIRTLQGQGVYVAIATGRAPFMFKELREELGITSFVSFNGSYVVVEGEVVKKYPLTTEELKKLEEKSKVGNHSMVFLDHEGSTSNRENDRLISESIGSMKLPYPPFNPTYYHDNEVYQALLFCERHEEESYVKGHDYFDYIRWHPYAIDVLPRGGSKARGIEAVLEHLSIDREHSFAFGDALNDVEMLEFVGTGVAMGNGLDEAKKAANHITKHIDEDGIFHGLRHVGLLK